jgi:hypothetical protein
MGTRKIANSKKKPSSSAKKAPKKSKNSTKIIIKKEKPLNTIPSISNVPIFPQSSVNAIITYLKKGRPETEFKAEYAEQILIMMSQGMGIETVCLYLGVTCDVMRKWRKNNKNIDSLIKYGKQLEKQWWLEQGRLNIYNKDFNHVLWMMNMSNRFDWNTNKKEVNGKVAHAHLHKHEVALQAKVKESNDEDRMSNVLSILSKSGAFIRKEPVRRIETDIDTKTN